jgi:NADH-quinone oxidoreductase subunit G
MFSFLKTKLNNISNLYSLTGPYSSLETTFINKKFVNKIGNLNILDENNSFNDFQINFYVTGNTVKSKKIYIIINTNLRIENPLLNLKFKKLLNKNNIFIFFFGNTCDSNLNYYHIDNNINILYSIFNGKHFICNIIKNFLGQNNITNSIELLFNPNLFKYEKSFLNMSKLNFFKNNFKKFNISFKFNNILLNSGEINASELNCNNFLHTSYLQKDYLLYLVGCENLKKNIFLKNSKFNIYQGHHNDNMRLLFDAILPSTTFFEETNHYLNLFGDLQSNKFLVHPPVDVRSD